ncbi:MAG: hypothetical protein ACRD88_22605 [Terriglobia bacterium]
MTRCDGFSLASGCVWGGIAYLLGSGALERLVWGGILVSPLIGLAIGRVAAWLRPSSRLGSKLGRAFASLVGLYVAVSLFGLAVGVYDLATGDIEHRIASAVVIQAMLGVLWGVTFTGYVIILWPLAYLNHILLWRVLTERS